VDEQLLLFDVLVMDMVGTDQSIRFWISYNIYTRTTTTPTTPVLTSGTTCGR